MAIQFYKQTTVPQAQSPDGIYYVQTSQHEPFQLYIVHAGEVVALNAQVHTTNTNNPHQTNIQQTLDVGNQIVSAIRNNPNETGTALLSKYNPGSTSNERIRTLVLPCSIKTNGAYTGQIIIKRPLLSGSRMYTFDISMYHYNQRLAAQLKLCFYENAGTIFTGGRTGIITATDHALYDELIDNNIRAATNNNEVMLILGNPDFNWNNHIHIVVDQVTIGYSGASSSALEEGWEIVQEPNDISGSLVSSQFIEPIQRVASREWIDSAVVKLSGNQTVGGAKTFSTVPKSSQDAASASDLVRKSQMDTAVNLKANDNIVVKTINNQTVNGKKTFTTVPATHQAPSTGFDLANKDYVDSIGTPGLDDVLGENNQTDGYIEIVSDINNPTQNPRMFISVDTIIFQNTLKNFIIQSASSTNYASIGLSGSTHGDLEFHRNESTASAGIRTSNRIKAAPAINSDELMTLGQAAQSAYIHELDQIGFFNLGSSNATIGTVIFTDDSPGNGYYELTLSGGIPGRIYTFIFTIYDGQINQDIYLSNGTVHNQFEPFPPGTVLKLQYDQTNQKWWEIGGYIP